MLGMETVSTMHGMCTRKRQLSVIALVFVQAKKYKRDKNHGDNLLNGNKKSLHTIALLT